MIQSRKKCTKPGEKSRASTGYVTYSSNMFGNNSSSMKEEDMTWSVSRAQQLPWPGQMRVGRNNRHNRPEASSHAHCWDCALRCDCRRTECSHRLPLTISAEAQHMYML